MDGEPSERPLERMNSPIVRDLISEGMRRAAARGHGDCGGAP